MTALMFFYDPIDKVLKAGDDPSVVISGGGFRIVKIDGIDIGENLIPQKKVYFAAPGLREISAERLVSINLILQDKDGVDLRKPTDVRRTTKESFSRDEESFVFQKGKHYRLVPSENKPFEFKEITDDLTLSQIKGYLNIYDIKNRERKEKSKEVMKILDSYESYAKNNPGRLEGKWVSDMFMNEQIFEFSGDVITHTVHPGSFTEIKLHGTFDYDENTIVPRYVERDAFLGTMALEDGSVPGFGASAPTYAIVYYYELNGDKLTIRQNVDFTNLDKNHTGTYVKVGSN
jgi:hypothetical protein